jgi:hypothetical protein
MFLECGLVEDHIQGANARLVVMTLGPEFGAKKWQRRLC